MRPKAAVLVEWNEAQSLYILAKSVILRRVLARRTPFVPKT